MEGPITDNPTGQTVICAHAEGGKGGQTDAGHRNKIRHAARGAEKSGGGWRVTGGGEVQVYDIPDQERRWGAGVTKIE